MIEDNERPAAITSDSDYSLSIEDALARYEAAGIPRTRRSVQGYCANGALDSHRVETAQGREAVKNTKEPLVELSGIEPLTSSLRTRRSPN